MGRGINDGMCGYIIALREEGTTKDGFPSNHGQQDVTNLLDGQKDAIQPGLDSFQTRMSWKPYKTERWKRKGRYWVWGPR